MTSAPEPRVVVGGIGFDPLTEAEAVDRIVAGVAASAGGRVVTPNVDFLRQTARDPSLAELVRSADLVLADGMPIVWAARLAGARLPERVAGSSLVPRLAGQAAATGCGLFLLGGREGAAATAATRLSERHPGLRVGWHCPPLGFEGDASATAAVDAALDDFGPSVCVVGLGFPRQDQLGRRLLGRVPGTWFVGAGATIDFLAGQRRRAPPLLQRTGLEWAFRLAQEPRRLAARYAADLPVAARLLAGAARRR